jgi:hypothetical protein
MRWVPGRVIKFSLAACKHSAAARTERAWLQLSAKARAKCPHLAAAGRSGGLAEKTELPSFMLWKAYGDDPCSLHDAVPNECDGNLMTHFRCVAREYSEDSGLFDVCGSKVIFILRSLLGICFSIIGEANSILSEQSHQADQRFAIRPIQTRQHRPASFNLICAYLRYKTITSCGHADVDHTPISGQPFAPY